ncbi:MAG: CHAT domain-containing protein, partial [Candidatus Angelobacter sp.]
MGNLGSSYFELGDFEKARKNSQDAEILAERLHQTRDREKWLLDIGRAYYQTGQSGLAQEYYKKALNLAHGLGDDEIAGKCLHNLALMELTKGNLRSASSYHEQEKSLKLANGNLLDFKMDEANIAAAHSDWSTAEETLFMLLSKTQEPARLAYLQGRLAHVYAGQHKNSEADQWFRQSIATMEDAADKMKQIEFKIAMLDNWAIFDDYIAFLASQNRPERALQVAQLARSRTLSKQLGLIPVKEDARLWVARIRAMLRARGAVILAFYEADRDTYLWAITPLRLQFTSLGVDRNELETLADAYNEEIQQHSPLDASPAEQRLYQILIKPVRDLLPRGSHVILVADSALYRINFESLISDDGPSHYWIKDAEIENASSIDLLLAGRNRHRRGKGLLLIGAPDEVSPEFPPLPHASDEMESVQAHFSPAQVRKFSGSAATPEAFKTSNPGQFR